MQTTRSDPDSMTAREAWSWLQENRMHGLKAGPLHFYWGGDRVERSQPGYDGATGLDHAAFLNDHLGSTFRPLRTDEL